MAISGPAYKQLYQRTVNNGGTVTWTGDGVLYTGNGAVFNNPAGRLFDVQNDVAWIYQASPIATFHNAGTFRKSSGTNTTSLGAYVHNTGTIEVLSGTLGLQYGGSQNGRLIVDAGATVGFTLGGLHTFGAGNTNLGLGTFRVSGSVVSVETNVTATLPNLTLSDGTLSGDGTWTVTGLLDWTGGTIAGFGVLNANGGMAISGSAIKVLNQRTVNNGGTVTWTGSGYLNSGAGAVFNNPAGRLFDVQNDSQIYGQVTINNAGTFRKSAGPGTTYIGVALNNTGTVEVESGTLDLPSPPFQQTSGALLLKGGDVDSSNFGSLQIGGGSGRIIKQGFCIALKIGLADVK